MQNELNPRPRVVVTGIGAVTPLGSSLALYWEGLTAGRSGVRRITQFDPSSLPCQIAGEIPDFNPEDYMDRKEARRTPRACQIALGAAIQAMQDAGFAANSLDSERLGVVYGTVLGGVERLEEGVATLRAQGAAKVSPFMIPSGIPNIPAFMIAQQFQCLGPNSTLSTACATGTQAIGEAAELIRRGAADVVITGGAESIIADWAIAGFCAMRALPLNYNADPARASRPFDARREGFIFSEGAGALVLESESHARQRQARIYAEIGGHASSSDAFHLAALEPEGFGPTRAMRWALADAGLQPEQIDYINAHGTSTPINDVTETRAIKRLFGEHAYRLSVSSTKSMVGHAMGASGTLEAIAAIMAITHDLIPPTINYETPDPECDLDYTPNQPRRRTVQAGLSNSFGLGGQNACLVMQKYAG
ncbi:MAG: beta-ketoacyl-ACP synthase II [Anaerolineales bacterium]|jgi:beta-ketoacyl-acyl-carrier-protein synthase II|nr:beta-ketoacyl-ACP synthase II [Anaerolineales bacterium]